MKLYTYLRINIWHTGNRHSARTTPVGHVTWHEPLTVELLRSQTSADPMWPVCRKSVGSPIILLSIGRRRRFCCKTNVCMELHQHVQWPPLYVIRWSTSGEIDAFYGIVRLMWNLISYFLFLITPWNNHRNWVWPVSEITTLSTISVWIALQLGRMLPGEVEIVSDWTGLPMK